jgi:hypothetical protein
LPSKENAWGAFVKNLKGVIHSLSLRERVRVRGSSERSLSGCGRGENDPKT